MIYPQTICSIVKTLYPAYTEHLTSSSSEALIREHIKNCDTCQKYVRTYGQESADTSDTVSEVSYLKKYRTMFFAVLAGVALGVLLFALLLCGVLSGINGLMNRFLQQSTAHSESVSDYHEWETYQGISSFSIFPEDLSHCQSVNTYYYDCNSSTAATSLQLYLDCSYTLSEYEAEKERLLRTAHKDDSNTFFAYPACYTMLYYDTACEYALFLEKEHRILYISLQYISLNELVFEEAYLPLDYGIYGSPPENQAKPYCIYTSETKETSDYEK